MNMPKLTGETFTPRPREKIQANQLSGHLLAEKYWLAAWVLQNGGRANVDSDGRLYVYGTGSRVMVRICDWIVLVADGIFRVLTTTEFNSEYRKEDD